jgi:hypothetical protein
VLFHTMPLLLLSCAVLYGLTVEPDYRSCAGAKRQLRYGIGGFGGRGGRGIMRIVRRSLPRGLLPSPRGLLRRGVRTLVRLSQDLPLIRSQSQLIERSNMREVESMSGGRKKAARKVRPTVYRRVKAPKRHIQRAAH